ncbi:unnamed protein product, partial [Staurois parvus]
PRRRRAIHKAKRFSHLRSGHPAVTEAGPGRRGKATPRKWERVPVKFRYPLPLPPQRSAVSGHLLYLSGHPLYFVRSLWSSPVLCPQSLVIPCTVSAVHWFRIFFFFLFF